MPALIDLNVSFGPWPFQRTGIETPAALSDHLRAAGIERAFVSHLGPVFHLDPGPFNLEWIAAARNTPALIPVPVENPAFPGWQRRLEAYQEACALRAVKVHPNYHGYALDDPEMAALASYLEARGIPLLVSMRMEDERMRYFGLDIQGVPVDDIILLHGRHSRLLTICLNAYLPEARRLGREAPGVCVDTAFAEWMFTMELLLEDLPPERIFFGTHTPFLYTRAGVDKLLKAPIDEAIKQQIGRGNVECRMTNVE